jgi:hypothetical protein
MIDRVECQERNARGAFPAGVYTGAVAPFVARI